MSMMMTMMGAGDDDHTNNQEKILMIPIKGEPQNARTAVQAFWQHAYKVSGFRVQGLELGIKDKNTLCILCCKVQGLTKVCKPPIAQATY